MGVCGYCSGSVFIVAAIAIIIVIILQQGNQQGIGVTPVLLTLLFLKNKARPIDAKLARFAKVFAAIFVIIVIVLNVICLFCRKKFLIKLVIFLKFQI